jgi:predicted ATP-grasp superfamily ATP-dependent carboligase
MAVVLLFGGGLQTLSIARGLKDHQHAVFNISDRKAVGKYSRFIDKFSDINLIDYSTDNIIDFINRYGVDVVIPTEDEYAEWLSLHKEEIGNHTNAAIAVVNHELFSMVVNKNKLLSFCSLHNIPHPVTKTLNINDIENGSTKIGYPVLIKPDISNGSRGICKVNTNAELMDKAPEILANYGSCTIQEFIDNNHYYNVMLYRYRDGSYAPVVVTNITRYYPVKGGSSSFCTTIINNQIAEPCKKLLAKLDWYGFADFDVLEKGIGDYRIIEINPRVPASVHAAYISGINYGQIIVDDLMNQHKSQQIYQPGQHLRFLGLDIAWFLSSPKRFSTSPSWFKFFGKNLHYQEGGIKDVRAMAYSIWTGIKKQISPSFRKSKAGMN